MPLIERAVIKRAISNIATWGDTDVFPFPIDNHVLHDMPNEVASLLEDVAKNFDTSVNAWPVTNYSTLAPVGYTGFRWATQIDPMWNSYLLALVLSLAPQIESERIPEADQKVFSYRFREETEDGSLFALDGWKRFQDRTRELAESHEYVVSVDVADFYSRIYHHRLENSLHAVDSGKNKSRHIMEILTRLSGGTSYGLPVGGPAARVLAELVLNRVDRLVDSDSTATNFCRYADDYRFFVNDIESAYRIVGVLSELLLRNEGLTLQKSKTRIMTSAEYLSMLDPKEPIPGSASAFLSLHIHFDPYSSTAEEDYELLKEQLDEFDVLGLLNTELNKGRIHAAVTRRLVQALKYMGEDTRKQAVLSLLDNVETLTPVLAQAMMAIRDCLSDMDDEFTDEVHARIRDLIESGHHAAQVDLNLGYMIRVLAVRRSLANEQLLIQLFDAQHGFGSGRAPTIQRDIMLILARWQTQYWLSHRKNYISSDHPWVRRAFVISSYVLGDEGKFWRDANKATFSPYELVVRDWAAKQTALPDWEVPV